MAGSRYIEVYPNPNNGHFNIQLRSGKVTVTDLKILNMIGEVMMEIPDFEIYSITFKLLSY